MMRSTPTYLIFSTLISTAALAAEPPIDLRGTGVGADSIKWEWAAVEGAQQYEVYVDGIFAGTTQATSLISDNMWQGEHSLRVRSIDSDGSYSIASDTIKIDFSATFDSTDNNTSPVLGAADDGLANDTGLVDPVSWTLPDATDKPGYELVFSDEFNGYALNPARWNSQLRWDGEFNGERYEYRIINGEHQFYVNTLSDDKEHLEKVATVYNPFQFDGSRLAIRAKRNPLKTSNNKATFGSLTEMVSQQEFLSGAITSYDKFSTKYGLFEARIKIPSHTGTFPAFWLHHQNTTLQGTRKTEIDIMENLGHAPWYIYNSFHYFDNVSATYGGDARFIKPLPQGQVYTGVDYSEDYHVYSVKWEPGNVTWMIDGEVMSEVTNNNVNNEDLYVLLNLAMGGNWTNFPANAGGLGRENYNFFPNDNDLNTFADPALEIDYVRVYKPR